MIAILLIDKFDEFFRVFGIENSSMCLNFSLLDLNFGSIDDLEFYFNLKIFWLEKTYI